MTRPIVAAVAALLLVSVLFVGAAASAQTGSTAPGAPRTGNFPSPRLSSVLVVPR